MKTSPFSTAYLLLVVFAVLCMMSSTSTNGPFKNVAVLVMADEEVGDTEQEQEQDVLVMADEEVGDTEQEQEEVVEAVPTPPVVNCEALCSPRIQEIVATCEVTKSDMHASLDALTYKFEAKMEELINVESEVEKLLGQLENAKMQESMLIDAGLELQGTLSHLRKEVEDTWTTNKAHESTINSLKKELATVQEGMGLYTESRLHINWELLKSDGMTLLKKFGFIKNDEL
jgi:hypothetical protein